MIQSYIYQFFYKLMLINFYQYKNISIKHSIIQDNLQIKYCYLQWRAILKYVFVHILCIFSQLFIYYLYFISNIPYNIRQMEKHLKIHIQPSQPSAISQIKIQRNINNRKRSSAFKQQAKELKVDNCKPNLDEKLGQRSKFWNIVYKIRILRSNKYYNYFYLALTLISITALTLKDPNPASTISILSAKVEYTCNCIFILIVILRLSSFQPIHPGWCGAEFIAFVSGISTLFIDHEIWGIYMHTLSCMRVIIFVRVTSLYTPFLKFVRALKNVSTVVVPVFILVYLFSIVGLYAFAKNYVDDCDFILHHNQNALYQYNTTISASCGENQCGVLNTVTKQSQCLDYSFIQQNLLSDQNDQEQVMRTNKGYQILLYKNILYSFYNTYKIVFIAGWSKIASLQKQKSNEIFVSIYYLVFMYLVSFIYMNIFYGLMMNNQNQLDPKLTKIKLDIQYSKTQFLVSNPVQNQNCFFNKKLKQKQIQILQNQIILDPELKKNILIIAVKPGHTKQIKKDNANIFLYQNQQNSQSQKNQLRHRLTFLQRDYYLPRDQNYKKIIQTILDILSKIDLIFIFICCINMSIETRSLNYQNFKAKNWIDMACSIQICVVLFIKIIFYQIKLMKLSNWSKTNKVQIPYSLIQYDLQMKIQIFVTMALLAGFTHQFYFQQNNPFSSYPSQRISKVLRIVKYIRIYKLFFKQAIFSQIKIVLQSIVKVLDKLFSYIIFYFLMLLLFSLISYNLFHHKALANYGYSFNEVYKSFILVFMIFSNDQQQTIIFQQYPLYGPLVIVFHILCLTFGLSVLSKYFMTIFLTQLLQELAERSLTLHNREQQQNQNDLNRKQQLIYIKNNRVADIFLSGTTHQSKKTSIVDQNLQICQSEVTFKNKVRQKLQQIFNSDYFFIVRLVITLIGLIEVAHRSPLIDRNSNIFLIFQKIQIVFTLYLIIQLALEMFVFGTFSGKNTFFFRNKCNLIHLLITLLCMLSIIPCLRAYEVIYKLGKLKILRIIVMLNQFCLRNPRMKQTVLGFLGMLPKILWLLFIVITLYSFFALFFVASISNLEYYCINQAEGSVIYSKEDCFNWGGDWINNQMNLDYSTTAIIKLVIVSLTESWDTLVSPIAHIKGYNLQPNQDSFSIVYFICVLGYLIGSFIVLNLFIGYLLYHLKIRTKKQSGQSELNQYQISWLRIKQQIYSLQLVPVVILEPGTCKFVFNYIISSKMYKIFKIIFMCVFLIVSSLLTSDTSQQKLIVIFKIQSVLIVLSLILFLLQQYGRTKKLKRWLIMYHIVIFCYSFGFYVYILTTNSQFNSNTMMLAAILICLQLMQFWLYINHFQFIRKTLKYLNIILPRALYILILMLVVLLTYTYLSLEIFAYVKPVNSQDQFFDDYSSFFNALFTLIKFSTWQSPFDQIIGTSLQLAPNFICYNINTYQDYLIYGKNGCGHKYKSYIFFLSFHIIYTMILHSALMANILQSYNQVKQRQFILIKQFQFDKVTQQWLKFDKNASGFISAKKFWQFAQKLYSIYSVQTDQKQNSKQKFRFLEVLNIKLVYKDKQIGFQFYSTIQQLARVLFINKQNHRIKTKKVDRIYEKTNIYKKDQLKPTRFRSKHLFTIIILGKVLSEWYSKSKKTNINYKNKFRNKVLKSIVRQNQNVQMKNIVNVVDI